MSKQLRGQTSEMCREVWQDKPLVSHVYGLNFDLTH